MKHHADGPRQNTKVVIKLELCSDTERKWGRDGWRRGNGGGRVWRAEGVAVRTVAQGHHHRVTASASEWVDWICPSHSVPNCEASNETSFRILL